MRNRFGGSCYRCGKYVEAGAGHFEALAASRATKTKWRVQHAECAIFYRGTDHQYDKPETWNRQMQLPLELPDASTK
jgi:hypothetical protein